MEEENRNSADDHVDQYQKEVDSVQVKRVRLQRLSGGVHRRPVQSNHGNGCRDSDVVDEPHDLNKPGRLVLPVVLGEGHPVVGSRESRLEILLEEVGYDGVDHNHTGPEEVVQGEDYIGPLGDKNEVVGSNVSRHCMYYQPGHEVESEDYPINHVNNLRQPLEKREEESSW